MENTATGYDEIVNSCMEQKRKALIERCERAGERVPIKEISMALTNCCNCYCVMCPYTSSDTKQTGILTDDGCTISLEEAKQILAMRVGDHTGENLAFSFMSGETLLNPEVYEILEYIKEQYPGSCLILLTNGTIPPKNPRIVQYIDNLGFSIDGGSSEIYEKIRTPAKFDRVEKNIREWIRANNQYNPTMKFSSCTTISTLNIRDLPNIVRFLGKLAMEEGRNWDSIFLQAVVIQDYQDDWLKNITLEHVATEVGNEALMQGINVAKQYGIRMDIPDAIIDFFNGKHVVYDEDEICYMQRFCKRLEEGTIVYDASGKQKAVCCYMRREKSDALLEKYGLLTMETAEKVYNSEGYWKLRKDLLEGQLSEACEGCMIGCSEYFLLRQKCKWDIDVQRREAVENLCGMLDVGKTSYEDLKCITYDTMICLKQICDTLPNGAEMYNHIWERIVRGLFASHIYMEPDIIYHKEEEIEVGELQKLSVVLLAAEYGNKERLTYCMRNADCVECANIICDQMQIFC